MIQKQSKKIRVEFVTMLFAYCDLPHVREYIRTNANCRVTTELKRREFAVEYPFFDKILPFTQICSSCRYNEVYREFSPLCVDCFDRKYNANIKFGGDSDSESESDDDDSCCFGDEKG